MRNPFEQQPPNPFQAAKAPKPAMNDLLQQKTTSGWTQQSTQSSQQPQTDLNPFFWRTNMKHAMESCGCYTTIIFYVLGLSTFIVTGFDLLTMELQKQKNAWYIPS